MGSVDHKSTAIPAVVPSFNPPAAVLVAIAIFVLNGMRTAARGAPTTVLADTAARTAPPASATPEATAPAVPIVSPVQMRISAFLILSSFNEFIEYKS